MPDFIAPCLATLRDKIPTGSQWVHEIKFDGYRLQLHEHENMFNFSQDVATKRFGSLVETGLVSPVSHLVLMVR